MFDTQQNAANCSLTIFFERIYIWINKLKTDELEKQKNY